MVQSQAFVIYLSGPSPEGKFYVGQTGNFERRCRDHRIASGTCPHFHDAVKRFGWDDVKPTIIAQTDIAEEADRLERLFIAKYNALFPHGYNLTLGGRFTTFDPEAKITSFEEAPVERSEIIAAGRARLKSGTCPVCGPESFMRPCHNCGVHQEFAKSVLGHYLEQEEESDYSIPADSKIRKALRESFDADFLIKIQKSRLGVRKIEEVLPVVAAEYAKRLWPYIKQSLKREILVGRKLPSFTLGRFIPVPGNRTEAVTKMSVERLLRRHRKELGSDSLSNIEVFTKAFDYYAKSERRSNAVRATLLERGASTLEIEEAIAERNLLQKIESINRQERYPEEVQKEKPIWKPGDPISFELRISEPTEEELQIQAANLFADGLHHLSIIDKKPVIIVTHTSVNPWKIISFRSLPERRSFIEGMLALDPKTRLEKIQNLTSGENGLLVSDFILPEKKNIESDSSEPTPEKPETHD